MGEISLMDTCFLFYFLNCILQRMKSFAFIDNTLVVYVDNDEDYDYVRSIHQHIDQNGTCVVQLERSRMWAFSTFNKQRVQNITSSEGYHRIYQSTADYIHWCGMQNTRLAHQNIDKTMKSDEYIRTNVSWAAWLVGNVQFQWMKPV